MASEPVVLDAGARGLAKRLLGRLLGGPAAGVFRGMATLALGSGAARLIGIASIPILTRIYGPEDFGVLAVFTGLILLLAPILTWRYVLAIPLPRHDGLAMNVLVLSGALLLLTTLVVTVILWAFAEPLLRLMSMEALVPWWWLIALGLLVVSMYEMLTLWATRRRTYKIIAQTNVWQSAAGAIVKIALGLLAFNPAGLLVGQVVEKGAGIGSLLRSFRADYSANLRHVRLTRMKQCALRHRGFPIYRVPSQFLLVLSAQAPLLSAAVLYGAATTGQLGLAISTLALPLNLLGTSMGKAFYAEGAALGRREPCKILAIARSMQMRLLFIGVPAAAFFMVTGPDLFMLAFGENWRPAGQFAAIMSAFLVFQFISHPLVHILNVFNAQRSFLIINLLRSFLVAIVCWCAWFLHLEPIVFIIAYSAMMSVIYIGINYYIITLLKSASRSMQTVGSYLECKS